MKKIFLIYFLTITSIFAQQKIGHCDVESIIYIMPDFVAGQAEMQEEMNIYRANEQDFVEEYQTKMAALQENSTSMSEAMQQDRLKELQDIEERLMAYQQAEQSRLQQKEQEMLYEIMEKVQIAIDKVAKETGCAYILQSDGGMPAVLFTSGPNSFDITALVKKKLNL